MGKLIKRIKNKAFREFNNGLLKTINFRLVKEFPRGSVEFAKKYFKNKIIDVIEIGVFKGENAKNMFKNLNINKFYAIDPYKEYKEYSNIEPWMTQSFLNKVETIAKNKLKNKNISWIKDFSDNAIYKIPKVNFIYIDGIHSYEQIKKDMNNYWEKVKEGGILAGHDICENFDNYGTIKAFTEFCTENNLKPYISKWDWWVVKK